MCKIIESGLCPKPLDDCFFTTRLYCYTPVNEDIMKNTNIYFVNVQNNSMNTAYVV